MCTLDTAIYAIYIRYKDLLCLQKIQLSILSALDTAINCVYKRQFSSLSTGDAAIFSLRSRYVYREYRWLCVM